MTIALMALLLLAGAALGFLWRWPPVDGATRLVFGLAFGPALATTGALLLLILGLWNP